MSQPEAYLKLQPSEAVVVHSASRIFAAYITAGWVEQGNEAQMMEKAVRTSLDFALAIDRLIESDDEATS